VIDPLGPVRQTRFVATGYNLWLTLSANARILLLVAAREPFRPAELSELETFVLAVEEGSIARAAGRLQISTQAAAKRISQLEVIARERLLTRTRRGVTATDAGARLYPIAREALVHRSRVIGALAGAPASDPLRIAGMHRLLGRTPTPPAEELLRDTEAVMAAIFHASAEAIIVTRADDGMIYELNDAAVELLGYDQDELRGRTVFEVDLWEDLDCHNACVQRAISTRKAQRARLVLRTRDGDSRLVAARFEAVDLHDTVHILLTIHDLPGFSASAGGAGRRRAGDQLDKNLQIRFLDALARGDPKAAEAVADDALGRGVDVAAVHTQLIEPAMRSIGELWERNEITVAAEHLATAITVAAEHLATAISHAVAARIFARAYHAQPRSRERVMMAAVQGEHHVLGLRLAADVLEGAGYDVLYLGPDVPLPALLDACSTHQPALLGLTVSMWLGVPTLIWEIASVLGLEHPPRVMIGGRAVTHAVKQGMRAAVVEHSDQVLAVAERLLAAAPSRDLISPALAARVALDAPVRPSGTEELATIAAAFSNTSLAAADTARETARRAISLEQLAYRDPLTGLHNRRAFDDHFPTIADNAAVPGAELLLIDIDKFKQINDTHGHQAGDETLTNVGRQIITNLRAGEFAARLGGDEFVALLPATTAADAELVAHRITTAIANSPNTPPATVSIGIAHVSPDKRLTCQTADRALYLAKQLGGDSVKRLER